MTKLEEAQKILEKAEEGLKALDAFRPESPGAQSEKPRLLREGKNLADKAREEYFKLLGEQEIALMREMIGLPPLPLRS